MLTQYICNTIHVTHPKGNGTEEKQTRKESLTRNIPGKRGVLNGLELAVRPRSPFAA